MLVNLSKLPTLFFLNNDTTVTPHWPEHLLLPFQNHSDLAFIQPKILSYHQRTYFEYAGASGGMLDQLGYPYARGRIGFSLEQDLGQYNNPIEVIWASGTCLATRAQTFQDLGGFEERFFFYHEETDLCLRAINAGYRNLCQPSSIIYHKGAQSSQGLKFKKIMLVHRNNLFLITRNFPIRAQLKVLPLRILLDYLSCLYYFAKSQFLYIPAVLYAHFAYIRHLPWLIRTRSRSSLAYQKLRPFSIMWQNFVLKKERYSEVFPASINKIPTVKYEKILPENHIHRAQSKFLNFLLQPQVLLPLLSLILTFSWFRSAQLIAAGEEALVFYSPSRLLNLYNSPWYEVGTGYAMPVILPRITLLFLASLMDIIFPNWFVQALIFASLLLAGLFGMYLFVRSLTHNRSTALLAAIFYLFNTYTMSQIWGRMLYTSIVFWAALPLWLYFWSQWLCYS
ncbi:MAG: hypothetical protein KatS3mg087_0975 [Patescibacteria group bacterium]|nr:MAG: hypothetical protein KatS3mg087_0975 [Patescibacteria group bacterium]